MTTIPTSGRIHGSAQIDPQAQIAPDATIGAFAIVDGPVRIGPRCRIEPYACLRGLLVMGAENVIGPHSAIGTNPQSHAFRGEATSVEIGSGNQFGAFSTVHRGTVDGGGVTRIGDHNVFQTGAHVGHDVQVGSECVLEENCLLAGHVVVGDGCFLGTHTAIQQRVRLGRLSRVLGPGASSKDLPPFFVLEGYNAVVGPNLAGLRQAGATKAAVEAVNLAFRTLHRAGLALSSALGRIETELGQVDEIRELLEFIRGSTLGINAFRGKARQRFYA